MGMTRDGRASLSSSKKSNSTPVAPREKRLKLAPPSVIVAPRGELEPILAAEFMDLPSRAVRCAPNLPASPLLRFGLSENLREGGLISKKLTLGGPFRERCQRTTYRGAETSSIPCLEIPDCLFVTEPLLSMCSLRILTTSAIPSGFSFAP